jgi:hypothetical protein
MREPLSRYFYWLDMHVEYRILCDLTFGAPLTTSTKIADVRSYLPLHKTVGDEPLSGPDAYEVFYLEAGAGHHHKLGFCTPLLLLCHEIEGVVHSVNSRRRRGDRVADTATTAATTAVSTQSQ